MPTDTKITLSPQEQQLVNDREWILTKRAVTDKVYAMMGGFSASLKTLLEQEKEWMPAEVLNSEPKIYKGENYLDMPYVLLDHPRCFRSRDVFAIRTMFWWGHFFSFTLQLGGSYARSYRQNIITHRDELIASGFYLCVNEDPWQHHFEDGNYQSIGEMGLDAMESILAQRDFLKLSVKFDLDQWNGMPELAAQTYARILRLLKP
ncbi:MAG: hypothetical protein IPP31_00190 [Chitinophagaceae bacterium]|nr:hypothetical protein [Chitinophagaceae bacterium]